MLADREEQTALQQAREQARINRRLRGFLAGAGFLLVALLCWREVSPAARARWNKVDRRRPA